VVICETRTILPLVRYIDSIFVTSALKIVLLFIIIVLLIAAYFRFAELVLKIDPNLLRSEKHVYMMRQLDMLGERNKEVKEDLLAKDANKDVEITPQLESANEGEENE
jgi:hypothetical protein